jgi:hypothetical protein
MQLVQREVITPVHNLHENIIQPKSLLHMKQLVNRMNWLIKNYEYYRKTSDKNITKYHEVNQLVLMFSRFFKDETSIIGKKKFQINHHNEMSSLNDLHFMTGYYLRYERPTEVMKKLNGFLI